MPLPSENASWPPSSTQPVYQKMAEWAAWYSGEPSRLEDVYAAATASTTGSVPWFRFWRRARAGQQGDQRALLHVPVASDLAAVSASLLFGESPRFRIKEAHEDELGTAVPDLLLDPTATEIAPPKVSDSPEDKTEKRLLEIIARGGVRSRLIEAAETSAAIGGVYIYPAWDTDLFDFPVLAVAQADMAVPEFKWGYLVAVTFHRVLETISEGNKVYRHVERHEIEGTGKGRKAIVLNALYQGSSSSLGFPVSLFESEETLKMEPRVELPFSELDVQYIPNIRPNRLWRGSGHGVADIQGSETLLDAIDETYASWMRDIRLAKARLIIPRDYLRPDADNRNAATFDYDQELYTTLDMEPGMNADARSMMATQFAIRYLEHRSTAREFIERVVSNAGYSPATMGQPGDSSGQTRTGAALRVSEHKTVLTQRRKSAHWEPALEMVTRHLLLIDKEVFGNKYIPDDVHPSVEMSDSIIDQPLELAQTALAMKSADSASTETRVRILHPDWSDAEVASEVARIHDESAMASIVSNAGNTTPDAFGDPEKDAAATGSFPITPQKKGKQTSPPPTSPPYAKNL